MMDRLYGKWASVFTALLAALLLMLTPRRGAATIVGDYMTSNSTVAYTPISGATVAVGGTTDFSFGGTWGDSASTGTLPIGFDFVFEGTHYTTFSTNSAGLIIFGNATSGSFADDLTAAPAYPIAAPFWQHTNLYNGGGCVNPQVGISYLVTGSAPNRELVIEWDVQLVSPNNLYYWNGCSTPMNQWQARLHEGTNAIDFTYGTLFTNAGIPTSASIGLARSGTDFLSATPSGGTSMTTSAVTANSDIQLHQTPITAGTVYTFTPCFILVNGDTGQGGTSTMNDGDTLFSSVALTVPGTTTLSPMTLAHPNAVCGTRNYTMVISGPSASEYVFQSSGNQSLSGSLSTGQTLTPAITFTPAAAGTRAATLAVTDSTGNLVRTYILAGRGQTTTTTTLVSSLNPAAPTQSVTFTATVTGANPGGLVATGNVTFKEGSNVLGTVALDGSGQAAFTTASLPEGTYSITAEYAGDPYFLTSTSSAVSQVIQKFASTVSLSSSLNPSHVGDTVTFTTTVTVPGGAPTPTGNVNFYDAMDLVATVALNGSAQAVYVNTTFISANHAMRAQYVGDATTLGGTSATINQLVYRNDATIAGTTAPNPSLVGEAVTITATVTPGMGAPVPTGNVTFTADSGALGIVALDGAGQAVLVTSALPAGARTITLTYAGSIIFQNLTTTISHNVDKNASAVALVSSNNPSLVGQPVSFTATVRGPAVGAPPGTGSVVFKEGASVLSTVSLDGNGQAVFTTSSLAAGSHSIAAEFAGDAYYMAGASSPVVQVVNQVGASVALTSSANPSPYAQSVTFTATATGSSVTPTGVMTFKEGSTVLGTDNLNGSGVATYSTSALGTGSHTITAEYGGDGTYTAGATGTVTQVIERAATTTALTVSTNSTTTGTMITWTATVTSTAAGTIGGTVTFNEGLTVIGTGTVGAGGVATTTATLPAGSHDVTATFGGDTNYATSTSSAVTTVVTQPEAGVDAGPDAPPDTVTPPIDVAADRTDTGTQPEAGRPDADAGADASTGDASADMSTSDTSMPPRSDVAVDIPIATPDQATPPADTRSDVGSFDVVASDVRSDAPRADGGGSTPPPGDDEGCSCRIGQRSNSRYGLALAGALVAATVLRARRRRRGGARAA